jgi:putative acetyltransferase
MSNSKMDHVTVESVRAPTDEVRDLIVALDRTLAGEYSAEQRHGLSLESIFQPHVRFFIARLDGTAMGCGGVALFETFAEVKRMYVRDDVRGRGIGRALLERIEAEARESGQGVLRLETGDRQIAAMQLYERAGFRSCEAFGDYAAMTPAQIATSVFMEKPLV